MNKILSVINDLEFNRHQMNISHDSIEFICMICKSINVNNVLEIGCFNGYSALWLSLFSKHVTTMEIYSGHVSIANDNFSKANVKNINIIEGDAVVSLDNLNIEFDIVLIDAMKSQYKVYLEKSLKLLNKDGIIFADNTISHKDKMKDFFDYLESNKERLYFIELNIGRGLMMICKR